MELAGKPKLGDYVEVGELSPPPSLKGDLEESADLLKDINGLRVLALFKFESLWLSNYIL